MKGVIHTVLPDEEMKLFIFGSQAGLQEWKNADIDVGIEMKKPIDWEKLETIKSMVDGIPTVYKFDIVDFGRVSESFRTVAMKKTEPI